MDSSREDCDDTDADVNDDADEVGDGIDNNCDGVVDGEDAIDLTARFPDSDGDGYGDASGLRLAAMRLVDLSMTVRP